MGAEVFKEIMSRLDELISALGQGAAHVYGLYVRQQIAYAATDYLVAIVAAVMIIILLRCAALNMGRMKELRLENRWGDGEKAEYNNCENGRIFQIIFAVIAGFTLTMCVANGTMRVVNPEYYAIKHLMEDLIPKK